MAYEKKNNTGTLFKNNRKTEDTHADYNGDILIDGKEYWLNGWIKQGKNGKFFSLSAKPKKAKADTDYGIRNPTYSDDIDSEIPFNASNEETEA